ncbi:lateral flagellin LafA [Photobacterium sp. BZF1]|uniref:lateral flagellin LafA n=1 Tax=Photobacterium sp. BZF1 TaxID=1904457 RepID=UPI001653889B|nr:lateral flagellin LafA [Photobacterium sp. BZF1]MBC7001616.1 lateral flagellin LafA [Photobacterium sp. BZF1]
MAISVHTNYASLVTQNTLQSTNNALTKSLERLSTGFRINSAADDAAGLQIANRLEAQSRGMTVAMRNSQDAISMLQTGEGAFDEMTNIAYRMNDLATQAANGTNTAADRAALDAEYQQLGEELANVIANTNFGGNNLIGAAGVFNATVDFQIGSTSAETLTFDATLGATSTALADLKTFVGTSGALGIGDLTSQANATTAMDALTGDPATATDNGIIGDLGEIRSTFGATINRLEHTITNLGNMTENVEASKGRIMDTDFASESGMMSKSQMLMQSGASMLSASKMVPQLAMSLLG